MNTGTRAEARPRVLDTLVHVESRGGGPPLVLLHGWGLHAGLFDPLAAALAPYHRVHAVDLPGHGQSGALRPWTLEGVVARLECAFQRESRPLHVLGWSLGGLVALSWALAHPERIARLALVSATPRFVQGDDWPHAMARETLRRFGDELAVAYRPTLQRFVTLQVQGSEAGRTVLAGLRARLFERGEPDRTMLADALKVLETADLRGGLQRLRAPTLVVHGDRDALVPPEAGRWLAQSIPGARAVVIEGAAHAPFLSHPLPVLAALRGHLADG
jgi:pimeloyl-[acyl-carrier protein] methyl ester esterase